MTQEQILQNFCYDTENIALYTNEESAPRLFALLDSMGFTWGGEREHPKPQFDNDLIFLYYELHKIHRLSPNSMFNTEYGDIIYFSAKKFLDLLDQGLPF